MKTGLLWNDNDSTYDLIDRIERAAIYYQQKYGQRPDICFVHPSLLNSSNRQPYDIEVRPNRCIRPGQLWLGLQNTPLFGHS